MNVLLLSKYSRRGASSRLRSFQYLPYLESHGINVVVSSLFNDTYLENLYGKGRRSFFSIAKGYISRLIILFSIRSYDVIWIEYEVFPYFPAFVERIFKLIGKPYVVDYDDAIFHNYDLSTNPLIKGVLGKKIDNVMKFSSAVIAGNDYLAQRAHSAGAAKVHVVPTVVDLTRYQLQSTNSTGNPVIGWIGTPATQKYVIDMQKVLANVCECYGASLLLVGADADIGELMPLCKVEVAPWSEEMESSLIAKMTIGIMPLLDGPWEKGKCGYKLIQYMASGVPVVASSVGANIDIVNRSQCGFLASDEGDWKAALSSLLESKDVQLSLGAAGRKAVEQKYSLQAQAPLLAKAFIDILACKP